MRTLINGTIVNKESVYSISQVEKYKDLGKINLSYLRTDLLSLDARSSISVIEISM